MVPASDKTVRVATSESAIEEDGEHCGPGDLGSHDDNTDNPVVGPIYRNLKKKSIGYIVLIYSSGP